MAVRASFYRILLFGCSGETDKPIGIRQLRRKTGCLPKLKIGSRALTTHDVHRRGPLEVVSPGPYAQGVMPWLQSAGWESVTASFVTDYSECHGRAVLFRTNQYPF